MATPSGSCSTICASSARSGSGRTMPPSSAPPPSRALVRERQPAVSRRAAHAGLLRGRRDRSSACCYPPSGGVILVVFCAGRAGASPASGEPVMSADIERDEVVTHGGELEIGLAERVD